MARPDADQQLAEAAAGTDRLLDHRTRLALCVLLARRDRLSFSRLKDLLQETDGSLGAHLRRLEASDYVAVKKEFVERKPVSWYALTPKGRETLRRHVAALEQVLGGLR